MLHCLQWLATGACLVYGTNSMVQPFNAPMATGPLIMAIPEPTCPDGYTLVTDLAMRPKCARDIVDPVQR